MPTDETDDVKQREHITQQQPSRLIMTPHVREMCAFVKHISYSLSWQQQVFSRVFVTTAAPLHIWANAYLLLIAGNLFDSLKVIIQSSNPQVICATLKRRAA